MGWGRMLLLGDIGQQLDIGSLEREIRELRLRSVERTTDVATLEQRLTKLEGDLAEIRLFVAVLTRIATSKGTVTREQLERIVEAIDLSDGAADGKLTGGKLPG